MLEALFAGFETALTFTNLLFILAGITLGIIIGVIPGLGSVTAKLFPSKEVKRKPLE